MAKKNKKKLNPMFIRNFTFGVEDSLASTVGLLSGIAAAQATQRTIIISGLILIFTEALSMAVGSFITEESVEEYSRKKFSRSTSFNSAIIMFVSYFLAGLFPIAPYVFIPIKSAIWLSIGISLLGLVGLGYVNARMAKRRPKNFIIRTLALGGSVAIAGVVIGNILKIG